MRKLFIKDIHSLASNSDINGNFAIKDVQLCPNKGSGHYLSFELADVTGSLKAKWWDRDETHCRCLETVRYGYVVGKVNDYKETRSIIVTQIDDLGDLEDCSDFELTAPLPITELRLRIEAHIASIRNSYLASLVTQIFQDPCLRLAFEEAPAAMYNHHSYRHGLLQHTLEVTDIAAAIADCQKSWGYERCAERDLVVAGALLHDIGKVRELSWKDNCNAYTRCGSLLGHITLGTTLVASWITKVPGFPSLLRDALLHTIVAHHGKLEWGSAVEPMMSEAQIIHASDLLDAQLYYMHEAEAQANTEFARQKKLDGRKVFVRSEAIAPAHPENPVSRPNVVPAVIMPMPRRVVPVLRFVSASAPHPEIAFETRKVPILGNVAAGSPLAAEQLIEDQVEVEAEGLPSDPQTFLLRVRGNSMAGDGIVDGDLVVVRPQEHHEPEDIVVALLSGSNEAAIKRVEIRGGAVFLMSSNPDFAPIPVPEPADLQVRGRVVALLQREAGCG